MHANVFWLVGSQSMVSALGFVGAFVLARALDASGKGAVNFVQTVTGLTATVLCLGMPGAANYLSAKRLLDARKGLAFVGAGALVTTLVALGLLQILGTHSLAGRLGAPSEGLLLIAVAAVLPSLLLQGSVSLLLGSARARHAAIVQAVTTALTVSAWAVLWGAGVIAIELAVASLVAAQCTSLGLSVYFLSRVPPVEGTPSFRVAVRSGLSFGLASWVSSGIHLLALRVDVLLLSSLLGLRAIGVYLLAVSLAELSWHLPKAVYATLFPHVASTGTEAAELVARTARQMLPLTLLMAAVAYAGAAALAVPIFGPQFVEVAPVCGLLIPGIVAGALGNVWTSYLAGINHPWKPTLASIVTLGVDVAGCLALVPRFGIRGAAIATSISYLVGAIVLFGYFSRQARLSWRVLLIPTRGDFSGLGRRMAGLLKVRSEGPSSG